MVTPRSRHRLNVGWPLFDQGDILTNARQVRADGRAIRTRPEYGDSFLGHGILPTASGAFRTTDAVRNALDFRANGPPEEP